jgi:hypothetical protein
MAQAQPASAVVDEGDAFRSPVYPSAELPVPYLNGSAGRRVGALRVNQKLVLKWVFIVPGRRFQKGSPAGRISCDAVSSPLRKLRNQLQFRRQLYPSLSFRHAAFLFGLPHPFYVGVLFLPETSQIMDFIQCTVAQIFKGGHTVIAVMPPVVILFTLFAFPGYKFGGSIFVLSDDKFRISYSQPVGNDITGIDFLIHVLKPPNAPAHFHSHSNLYGRQK